MHKGKRKLYKSKGTIKTDKSNFQLKNTYDIA